MYILKSLILFFNVFYIKCLDYNRVDMYLKESKLDEKLLNEILVDGTMNGFYTLKETENLFEYFNKKYP